MPLTLHRGFARILLLATLLAAASPGRALLNIDGSRNQMFFFGGVTYSYTSNLYAEPVGRSDSTLSAQVGMDFKRRAGIIAVSSTFKCDFIRYAEFTDEDTINPNFALELTKTTGRTTGALTVKAYRETRTDSAVNLRTTSWNLPVGLGIKYPVNDKMYVTSSTDYLRRTYTDNEALVDYSDISESLDLFYVYTSKLDLIGGYRFRVSQTDAQGRTTDHWLNIGATGGLFSKLSGTIRVGYQRRNIPDNGGESYDQFNAQASLSWPITRKLSLALLVNRDFNTIATGYSVDSTSAVLSASYSYSRKITLNSMVSPGLNQFLGETQGDRRDTFFSWNAGIRYKMNEHLEAGASYSYIRNWSTLSSADYDNHGVSVDISSRY